MRKQRSAIKNFIVSLLAIAFLLPLASCSGGRSKVPDELYSSFSISVTSPKAKRYLIHFIKEGVSVANAYASSESFITFPCGADSELTLDLKKEFDSFASIMKRSSDIKIVVSSEDDPFIRNPLSEPYDLRLYVVEGEDGAPVIMSPEISVSLNVLPDKESSGISLAFPNASFIVKLDVSGSGREIQDDTKFEVFLADSADGKRIGRVCRGFNYWEAPFYKSEIASKTLDLIIKEFGSDKELSYENSPMTFTFNENGLCSQGSVIRVKLEQEEEKALRKNEEHIPPKTETLPEQ
ncbi:MAG: hypothetical protein IJS94_01720 [Clostridia bacterium]|nr:hypothetical protein [Clostridia bacterium]